MTGYLGDAGRSVFALAVHLIHAQILFHQPYTFPLPLPLDLDHIQSLPRLQPLKLTLRADCQAIDGHARAYSPQTVSRVGSAAVAALSSTLPTLAILVLYFVKDMVTRLGLVILFTTIFAFALAVLTDAKKVEIFSATAAFAAVEVVYIGSTSTAGGSGGGA